MARRIISVSRRTDVPAFYGRWFMERVGEGFVERCYFSFVMPYRKVERNFRELEQARETLW